MGFKSQREDVELAGVEVGEVGVGIDVILPVNQGTTPFMLNSLATGKIESVFNGFKDRKWPLTSLKHFS